MNRSALAIEVPLLARQSVAIDFDGGDQSSEAGLIPLALADQQIQLTRRLADAIADPRDPDRIAHSVHDLFRERIYLIAQGYEDAIDANPMRHDPLLKLAVGRSPHERSLASQSTLSRWENAVTPRDLLRMAHVLLDQFVERCGPAPQRIVLDLDPFADECHGRQQLSLFNGHYECYGYLPLYLCGSIDGGPALVIGALLRDGLASPTQGARSLLRRVVRALRARYPQVEILVRGDGGFGVPEMLDFCHNQKLLFCFGKPQNARLHALSQRYQIWAAIRYSQTKPPHREYGEFEYQAESWRQAERTIVKAEVTQGKLNPRFVVTNLGLVREGEGALAQPWTPEQVYAFYCGRGANPENRIKEFTVDLKGNRLSCQEFLANQFRLLLHVGAYLLIQTVQRGLSGTEWASAQAGRIRVALLKVAARVRVRCRGVRVQMPTSYPWQRLWRQLVQQLQEARRQPPGDALGRG
jgi:Transposase DDE domain group 1